ncbi:MAG: class II aldolase/adducin family protein [Planctomycetota bacterium]
MSPTEESCRREELTAIAHRTYAAGFVAATDGNLSARLGDGTLLITPSGCCLGEVAASDFVRTDAAGRVLEPGTPARRPSSELQLHLAIYEERPDVCAVLHAHPPIAIGFTIAGLSLASCVIPEVIVGLGTIPTVPYTTPTTRETADAVRPIIRRRDAIVLEHHGSVTVGPTILAAFRKLEKVEHTAKILFVAHQLGGIRALPPEEVERLLRMRDALGLPPLVPGGGHGVR